MVSRIAPLADCSTPGLPAEGGARPAGRAPRLTNSEALLCGQRELLIEHAGNLYRLRVTQQNKLILTK
jgi:hemin uptake protein HemP